MKAFKLSDVAAEARADRLALKRLFPRGRFDLDSDGSCVLVSRQARKRAWKIYMVSENKTVGLYYEQRDRPEGLFRKLKALIVKILDGERDGILHLRWDARLADLLPEFSRGRRRGRSLEPAVGPVCAPGTGDLPPTGKVDPT